MMMKTIIPVLSILLAYSLPGYAKDKESSIERAIKDELRDEIYDDNNQKGKGKPDNPGQHGRDNAAQKQRENSGKGSKGADSWEDIIRDEIDDDDKGKNKNKNKNK